MDSAYVVCVLMSVVAFYFALKFIGDNAGKASSFLSLFKRR